MVVAIAGATGLTGSHTLNLLLHHPQVSQVIAVGRRKTMLIHPKLTEVILQQGQLPHPVTADAFVCCLGTTIRQAGSEAAFAAVDLELPLYLATQLHAHGCQSAAVVSAMLADANSRVFYNRIKGRMEEGMKAIGFRALHLLRPSLITGERQEQRNSERVALLISRMINPLLVGPLRNYRSVPALTIAKALVQAVISPSVGTRLYLSNDIKILAES